MDKEKVIKEAERMMRSTVDRDMIDSFCEDVIALLKELDTVKPSSYHHLFVCPVCKNSLFRGQKFCHECGKRIEWEGRLSWNERVYNNSF